MDRLHHIALTVSDLESSAAWYAKVQGMVEQFREDTPNRKAVIFGFVRGSMSVGLVQHVGSRSEAFDPTITGLDHFAFSVRSPDELRLWAAHLDECGVEHSGPIAVPPGEILNNFKDPEGIAIALFWDSSH